jgi:hypothetical protein
MRYGFAFSAQIGECAYKIDRRLARWLLMCHDRIVATRLKSTHDYMATMFIERTTISYHCTSCAGGSV